MSDPLIVPAREGIEAQRGLNDIFPGDPYPVSDQLKRGLDALRAQASGRGRISSLEIFALTDPLMDILSRCQAQPVATPAPHGDYWHSINTAPEDEHVILATSGDHVGEALMLRDQDTGEQKWTWAGGPVSKFHTPLGWRPMPSPIRFAVPDDNRSGGFDGPTGAE